MTAGAGNTPPALHVPQEELDDLRARLHRTRWAREWPDAPGPAVDPWQAGTSPAELRRLVEHWASGFDWRAQEAAINLLPGHQATVAGVELFYLRFDAETPDALPLVLTNGWPSSFLELVQVAERLSVPSRFGGGETSFTVVVPALPGFSFSSQAPALPPAVPTHELWHLLMREELGFRRYGAHGGDLGAGTTSLLAEAHPDEVAGIHLLSLAGPAGYAAGEYPEPLTGAERAYLDQTAAWLSAEGAYQHQQGTKPFTLAAALSDSPAGLLAWIVEKYRAWSDCDGDLSRRFTDDFLLTQASLYWFTNTISTSFRPYYEYARGLTPRVRRVTAPTAVAVFPADLGGHPPREWAERTYNVTRYTRMPRGGHFAAHEEPDLLAADIREFFEPLR